MDDMLVAFANSMAEKPVVKTASIQARSDVNSVVQLLVKCAEELEASGVSASDADTALQIIEESL